MFGNGPETPCIAIVLDAVELFERFIDEALGNGFGGIDRAGVAENAGEDFGSKKA